MRFRISDLTDHPGFVTRHLTQGKKMARDLSLVEMSDLWHQVVRQVEDKGFRSSRTLNCRRSATPKSSSSTIQSSSVGAELTRYRTPATRNILLTR